MADKPAKRSVVGRISEFTFRTPATFYGVVDAGGFVLFAGTNQSDLSTIRDEMCNGVRGNDDKANVHMIQVTITNVTPGDLQV